MLNLSAWLSANNSIQRLKHTLLFTHHHICSSPKDIKPYCLVDFFSHFAASLPRGNNLLVKLNSVQILEVFETMCYECQSTGYDKEADKVISAVAVCGDSSFLDKASMKTGQSILNNGNLF